MTPDDLIFAQTVKSTSSLKYARKVGVKKMTFDGESEIIKIAKYFPEATPLIRLKVSDEGATLPLGKKFGTPLNHIKPLLELAQKYKVNVIGIAFHVGSNMSRSDQYANAMKDARQAFDFAHNMGFRFKLLDIGGGYPSAHRHASIFEGLAQDINQALDKYFPKSDPRFANLEFESEPGRWFTGEFPVVTKVIGEKTDAMTQKQIVFLNDGRHNSFHSIHVISLELSVT